MKILLLVLVSLLPLSAFADILYDSEDSIPKCIDEDTKGSLPCEGSEDRMNSLLIKAKVQLIKQGFQVSSCVFYDPRGSHVGIRCYGDLKQSQPGSTCSFLNSMLIERPTQRNVILELLAAADCD